MRDAVQVGAVEVEVAEAEVVTEAEIARARGANRAIEAQARVIFMVASVGVGIEVRKIGEDDSGDKSQSLFYSQLEGYANALPIFPYHGAPVQLVEALISYPNEPWKPGALQILAPFPLWLHHSARSTS